LQAAQPDDPAVLYGLARCRRQLGQPDEARRLFDALLAARPEDHQALAQRGRLLLETGDPEAAEGDLRQALAQDPHDRRLLYSLFQCLERVGKKSEAREYAAQVEHVRADMDRVDELTERIRRSAPHDPSLRHEVGTLLLRNGYHRNGLQWLGTALQEDPEHRPTHQALAEFYERTGKPDLAARHRRFLH
jgi:predicted Zn-dependent protease